MDGRFHETGYQLSAGDSVEDRLGRRVPTRDNVQYLYGESGRIAMRRDPGCTCN